MKITHALGGFAVAGIVLLLSGCLLPEDFDARVQIHKDGSATFLYTGKLAYVLVLADLQQPGAAGDTDQDQIQSMLEELQKESGVRSVEYVGNARYAVKVERTLAPGEDYAFPPGDDDSFLQIDSRDDGTLAVQTNPPDDGTIRELEPLGMKVRGTLHVGVDKGVEVLEQNAGSTPAQDGMSDDYGWEIRGLRDQVRMVVKTGS